jgi:malonyl CoA-acyl carrier protein transacylase
MKAYIFPGQGAQFPGMGKDLYEQNEQARELFEQANEILGFRITDVMFDGTEEDLKQTNVTQPAIFCIRLYWLKFWAMILRQKWLPAIHWANFRHW